MLNLSYLYSAKHYTWKALQTWMGYLDKIWAELCVKFQNKNTVWCWRSNRNVFDQNSCTPNCPQVSDTMQEKRIRYKLFQGSARHVWHNSKDVLLGNLLAPLPSKDGITHQKELQMGMSCSFVCWWQTMMKTWLCFNILLRFGKWDQESAVEGTGALFNWPSYNERVWKPDGQYRPAYVCHMRDNVKYTHKKMWHIAQFVRGLSVDEAIKQLNFINKKGAFIAAEVWHSNRLVLPVHNVLFVQSYTLVVKNAL